jgi:hypothetical protein
MGKTSHTDSGWLDGTSQVSGFERATKQLVELAKRISWNCRLAQTSMPGVTTFPFPNQWEVYSQTYPAIPSPGMLNANSWARIVPLRERVEDRSQRVTSGSGESGSG